MPDPTHFEQPPEAPVAVPTLAEQLDAIAALRALVDAFPHLPAAYFTVHEPPRDSAEALDVQISTQTGFEQWREALRIPPAEVRLVSNGRSSWLTASGAFCGVSLEISTHALPAVGPRDGSEPDATEAPTAVAA